MYSAYANFILYTQGSENIVVKKLLFSISIGTQKLKKCAVLLGKLGHVRLTYKNHHVYLLKRTF